MAGGRPTTEGNSATEHTESTEYEWPPLCSVNAVLTVAMQERPL